VTGPSINGTEIDSNYYFYVDGPEQAYYFVDAPDVVYEYYFVGSAGLENMDCENDIVPEVKKCKAKIPKKNETCSIPTPSIPTPTPLCIGPNCPCQGEECSIVLCIGDKCPPSTITTPTTPTYHTLKVNDCVYYGNCSCYYY
jgi:hypothetical protein